MEETNHTEQTPQKNEPRLIWAAVMLTFLTMGLGHVYSGELRKGIGLFISFLITYASLLIICGLFPNILIFILTIVICISWLIYSIYDAARIAKSKQEYRLKGYNKWYLYILIALVCSFFVSSIYLPVLKSEVLESYKMPSGSMENTILTGDYFFVNKFIYKLGNSKPHRNDIVVFQLEGMRDEVSSKEKINYIKRIAGIPGDTLKLENYVVYINNALQPTPIYAKLPAITFDHTNRDLNIFPKGSKWNEENYGPVIIPKRNDIISLNVDNIEGWKVFIEREKHSVSVKDSLILIDNNPAFEYKVERNYYFMLGDSRNSSLDSRYWGFVPEENITGNPTLIYWSWDVSPRIALYDQFQTVRWERIGKEIK